jgi:glutamate-1-semialdehyde aminotransferase
VAAGSVTVAPHATEVFALGKAHKDIAVFLTSAAANDDLSEQQVLKELVSRSAALVDSLKSIADAESGLVTVAAIKVSAALFFMHPTNNFNFLMCLGQAQKMQKSMMTFLYNLAQAEGLLAI